MGANLLFWVQDCALNGAGIVTFWGCKLVPLFSIVCEPLEAISLHRAGHNIDTVTST